jgi:hypothetical protein
MATVYANSNDSWRRLTDSTSWAHARGSSVSIATAGSSTASNYAFAIYNTYEGGRGSNLYYCARCFYEFDLSGESGIVSSVSLNLYSDNTGTAAANERTLYIVQATALANGGGDYGNVFSSGTTLGTFFGSGVLSESLGYHTINFNSDGVSAVNSAVGSGTLTIGAMGYYDYNNSAPSLGGNTVKHHQYFADYTGTSRDPYLDITYSVATDNSILFGTDF